MIHISIILTCNNYFCSKFGTSNPAVLSDWSTGWRRLWRNTIRGNLKMVIAKFMCRTAVCKVPVLRRSVFWGLWRVSLLFPDVLWRFEEPELSQTGEALEMKVFVAVGRNQKKIMTKKKRQRPEEEFLSSLLFDDVELVVVPQSTGHFLICHIITVL